MKIFITTLVFFLTASLLPIVGGAKAASYGLHERPDTKLRVTDPKMVGLFDFFKRNKSYNVYFYFPDDTERYLGISQSVSDCQSLAINYANNKNIIDANWGYICCLKTKKSECAEKHR